MSVNATRLSSESVPAWSVIDGSPSESTLGSRLRLCFPWSRSLRLRLLGGLMNLARLVEDGQEVIGAFCFAEYQNYADQDLFALEVNVHAAAQSK
jgi:hypothetical protein